MNISFSNYLMLAGRTMFEIRYPTKFVIEP